MDRLKKLAFCALAPLLAVTAPPPVAFAQQGDIGDALSAESLQRDLRARQAELFDQLLLRPDDLDLMFEYARVSMRLEDYEAAISTLERMLIFKRDLPRVRLELGAAYFNLGSYEVAKLYFDRVLEAPSVPENVRERVQRYLDVIETRTQISSISGTVSVGGIFSSNANLGPLENTVQFVGIPVSVSPSSEAESDVGLRVLATLTHTYDLQRQNTDAWITQGSFYGLRYQDQDAGDLDFLQVRTGPRLSLDEQTFGPKLRPFVEGQYLRADDEPFYGSIGAGLEYTDTLSDDFSIFSDVKVEYREFFQNREDEDAVRGRLGLGVGYIPVRDVLLRAQAFGEIESAEADFNSNFEVGLRLSAAYQYDVPIAWVDRKWLFTGYVEATHREFDTADVIVNPDVAREDDDFRAGFSHIFALQQGFSLQLDVDALKRDSSLPNFELENVSTALSLRYVF